jgi:hypothetical protein
LAYITGLCFSKIYPLGVEGTRKTTMTTTVRYDIRGQATESPSMTPGLYSVTSDRADGAGNTASRVHRRFTDVKEAGDTRDEQGSLAEENLDSFVAWYTVTPLGRE